MHMHSRVHMPKYEIVSMTVHNSIETLHWKQKKAHFDILLDTRVEKELQIDKIHV